MSVELIVQMWYEFGEKTLRKDLFIYLFDGVLVVACGI